MIDIIENLKIEKCTRKNKCQIQLLQRDNIYMIMENSHGLVMRVLIQREINGQNSRIYIYTHTFRYIYIYIYIHLHLNALIQ